MDHELTAKWHELDKIQIGLKDAIVLQPDLSAIQRQIGDLADLTTEAKENLVAAINEAARTGGGSGSMDLRVAGGYIQYSTDSGSTWTNLIAVADLKGDKGDKGDKGEPGEKGDTGAQGEKGDTGATGADGITPHIGDNGNWYLGTTDTGKPSRGATGAKGDAGATGPQGETGPAGPAGPVGPAGTPGKDGTGMDITGATVGQIAKITAVDASGVPTGWEAVDMPSGGGGETWEKIAEIELRSDTAEYVLADFATWRKAKVIMTRPTYISGLSKNVWCKVVGQNAGDTYSCGYLLSEYGYAFWEFSAEVNDLFVLTQTIRSNNTNSPVNVQSTGTFTPLRSPIEKYKFELIFVDTSVIQAGDKVTVIGVRR